MLLIKSKPLVHLLRLSNYPILQQLYLEEALLRSDSRNWFIVNDGTPDPSIVLGISGNIDKLVHVDKAKAAGIPLIKRFTGGGTVVVDTDTIFTALIMSDTTIPHLPPYPRPIMRWTETFFNHVYNRYSDKFTLNEHDYAFQNKKFGGNAQAITRGRWLHHTSFLWDYQSPIMSILKHPDRVPEYRQQRSHDDFLIKLNTVVPCRPTLLEDMCEAVERSGMEIKVASLDDACSALEINKLIGTRLIQSSSSV